MQVPGTPLAGECEYHSALCHVTIIPCYVAMSCDHSLPAVAMFSEPPLRHQTPSLDQPDLGDVGGLHEAFTPELREKMVKLEKENEILRRRLESGSTEVESPLGKDHHLYIVIIQTCHTHTHTHTHLSLAVTAGSGGLHSKVAEQEAVMERQGKEVIELRGKLEALVKRAKEQSRLKFHFLKIVVILKIQSLAVA